MSQMNEKNEEIIVERSGEKGLRDVMNKNRRLNGL